MKYLLEFQYDGTLYKGLQFQKNQKTIQGTIEEKLKILFKKNITIFASGRTDAGVHSKQQFAHFLSDKSIEPYKFLYNMNSLLKSETIFINNITEVSDDFHARYSCKMKEYIYYFSLKRDLFLNNRYWQIRKFNLKKANECANFLIGTHDFSSFQDSDCQAKSPIKTIQNCFFEQHEHIIIMKIIAQSFLHHQVRIIAGTIQEIISRDKPSSTIQLIINEKNRSKAGATAPARGLYLEKIIY